jgi:hypothetical protein
MFDMPTVRLNAYAEIEDYTRFEEIKRASKEFAEKNKFAFMEVSIEEKHTIKRKD